MAISRRGSHHRDTPVEIGCGGGTYYVIFYFLTALLEINHIFSLPKEHQIPTQFVNLSDVASKGLTLSVSHVIGLTPS